MFYSIPYPEDTCPRDDKSAGDASFFSYPPSNDGIFMPKDPTIHKTLSISKALKKSLRWVTLGGQYDWTNKVYPDEEPPKFPSDIAELLEGMFPEMKAQAAIVNLYSPGDTLSLHRDVSEESDRGLASISLGCDCLFVVGLSDDPSDSVVIRLHSGDGIFMSEQARFAWHGVPKILAETCPSHLSNWPGDDPKYQKWQGWMKTKRINLNVRQMHD
jgi:alkylated DNA repair protein alkB family protein 1